MISIIMPIMNNMPYMNDAIQSIINNTNCQEKTELILVESESIDGSAEECDKWEKKGKGQIKVFHIPKKCISNALNYGIKQSKGDVYLTHADTIHNKLYKRDWLTELNNASKEKDVGLVTTLNAGGRDNLGIYYKGLNWIGTWSMYITRECINKVGLLDENMPTGDDVDYCYRVMKSGVKAKICNFWIDHHRISEHVEDRQKFGELVNRMGKYFKEKHKLE